MSERKEGRKEGRNLVPLVLFDWEDYRFRFHGIRTLLWLLNDSTLAEPLDLAETGVLDKETQHTARELTSRSAKAKKKTNFA